MSDDRDFQDTWRNWRGEEWSPEKARQNFRLYGPAKRAQALDQYDTELSEMSGIEPTVENMPRYLELAELRQDLDDEHHALLKANR